MPAPRPARLPLLPPLAVAALVPLVPLALPGPPGPFAGAGTAAAAAPAAAPAPAPARAAAVVPGSTVVVEAHFDPATAFVPPTAISHAEDLVPFGSHARVVVDRTTPGRTTLTLTVHGVAPDHEFPAHLHTGRCAADPAASGGHYQHTADGAGTGSVGTSSVGAGSVGVGDRDELRLTLYTDARGDGVAGTTVDWQPRPAEARSLVLHAGHPAGPHRAGDRAACVNLAL